MDLRKILLGKPGEKYAMMGNEAIARGAIEACVKLVTGYPGTPTSEIIDSLALVAKEAGIYVEWSVNEKVAFEIALGAALSGLRALVTMKAPGINVALDPIMSSAYSGTVGGLVILVGDDPHPHTTQTEQDSRWLTKMTYLPMIEPSDPQEAKDFLKIAYELSENFEIPVIYRTTTRINHTTADVTLGEVINIYREAFFKRDPERYVRASMVGNRQRHIWLLNTIEKIKQHIERPPFYELIEKDSAQYGIITAGVSYVYVREIIEKHQLDEISVLKLNITNPLPETVISRFLRKYDRVLILEELDPFLELQIKELAYREKINVEILGKEEGYTPRVDEFRLEIVKKAIEKLVNEKLSTHSPNDIEQIYNEALKIVPPRTPPMCPGCPHSGSYLALKRAIRNLKLRTEDVAIFGDIGCYALSFQPPWRAIWTEHAMGSSIGMAAGLKLAGSKQKAVATIGDSTFFHMGIQPLIDIVQHKVNILILILDNGTIAMTGHQPHPGTGITATGEKTRRILIEDIVKATGVEFVRIVDPYDIEQTTRAIEEALNYDGPSVIIARRECAIVAGRKGLRGPLFKVLPDKCVGCKLCIVETGCPAIMWIPEEKKVTIDPALCFGCSLCAQVCPYNAIIVEKR